MNEKKILTVFKYIFIVLSVLLTITSTVLIGVNFDEIKKLLNNNEVLTWGFLSTIGISIFSFINITFGIFIKIRQSILLKRQKIITIKTNILMKNIYSIISDNSISQGLRIKKINDILEQIKELELKNV